MRKLAILGLSAALAGCFYVDPINQRPGLEIRPRERPGDGFIHRGDKDVILDAIANDPDGQLVTFEWLVYACDNGLDFATCDPDPLSTSIEPSAEFDVPPFRVSGTPTMQLLAILNGRDDFGAAAKPPQQLVIPVRDALPDVRIDDQKPYDGVSGTPVQLFADYGDADDTAENVTIVWEVFPPAGGTFTLTELTNVPQPDDLSRRQVGQELVPTGLGEWQIRVTATDSVGESSITEHLLLVIGDEPPCLEELAPVVPPSGSTLPVSDPVLFQVLVVRDALDRFPTIVGDPFLLPAKFAWSMKVNTGAREALGTSGNSVAFDPANFALGDRVELRIDVSDRVARATCPDGDAECSLTGGGCFQRKTWILEVR
ncbi:MAG: hypothetical protein ABI867_41235 [Kofleriaceae bacterium]